MISQEEGNTTFRIVAGEDGKLKILLPINGNSDRDVGATKPQASPEKTVPIPSVSSTKKSTKKRPTAEKSIDHSLTKRANLRTAKRPKYERPNTFVSDLDWSLANCQASSSFLQEQLMQQLPEEEQRVVPFVSNGYGYNDSLSIIRSRMKKQFSGLFLKKGLTRTAFNQNQNFHSVNYKPSNSFFKYFTQIEKSVNTPNKEEKSGIEIIKKGTVETVGSDNGEAKTQMIGDKFLCAGCQRPEAKKYAKSLCQTCYKRQRKVQEESNGKIEGSHEMKPEVVFASPEVSKEPAAKEWTGVCPYCNRSDVKHYAKGKCMACYRKYRKGINKHSVASMNPPILMLEGEGIVVANMRNNN